MSPRRFAMNIVPTDEMTVEATKPHSRLKPPLTETLAIFAALVIWFFPERVFAC